MFRTVKLDRVQPIVFPTLPFSKLLMDAIENATATLVRVGGIIVFFYIMTEIMQLVRLYHLLNLIFAPFLGLLNIENAGPLFSGMMEFTQGVFKINAHDLPLGLQLALTAFIVSFAGLSVHTQVLMFAEGSEFRYLKYLLYRTLHGWASALIVLFSWHFFLNDLSYVFSPAEGEIMNRSFSFLPFTLAIIGFYFLLQAAGAIKKIKGRRHWLRHPQ